MRASVWHFYDGCKINCGETLLLCLWSFPIRLARMSSVCCGKLVANSKQLCYGPESTFQSAFIGGTCGQLAAFSVWCSFPNCWIKRFAFFLRFNYPWCATLDITPSWLAGASNSNCAEGQMRTYKITRGLHLAGSHAVRRIYIKTIGGRRGLVDASCLRAALWCWRNNDGTCTTWTLLETAFTSYFLRKVPWVTGKSCLAFPTFV